MPEYLSHHSSKSIAVPLMLILQTIDSFDSVQQTLNFSLLSINDFFILG